MLNIKKFLAVLELIIGHAYALWISSYSVVYYVCGEV
jgi:hypothetical protein